jgi:hypothetical protein
MAGASKKVILHDMVDDRFGGVDHNSGHPSNRPRHLTRNRLIAKALHWVILQLRLVLAGFMIKAASGDAHTVGRSGRSCCSWSDWDR